MATTEYKRIISKSGDGPATIPPSPSHDIGDWIETDIYENELYMDNLTGFLYTNIGGVIVQLDGGAVPPASETEAGIAEIATDAETQAGADDARIVTPLKLKNWWTAIKAVAASITGIWTFDSEKIRVKVNGANWYHALKSLASSNQIWSLPDEGDQTFASRQYVDNFSAGLKWKSAVIAATTVAGTLATDFENGDTLDGVVLTTGDRILIKDQAAATENGIYIVAAAGAPTRATDADTGSELVAAAVLVAQGTVNADKAFVCTNDSITIGVDNITFTPFSSILQSASETAKGVAELATQAETNAGADDERIVTPLKLVTWWTSIRGSAQAITGSWSFNFGKLSLFNAAATFRTYFQSLATADRTAIFPNKDITVAGIDDVINEVFMQIGNTNPADATTYYFGGLLSAVTTVDGDRNWIVRGDWTITHISVYIYVNTILGSAGNSTWNLRINGVDTLITNTIDYTAAYQVFHSGAVSINLSDGDAVQGKFTTPTWATNPTGTVAGIVLTRKRR